LKYDKRDPDPRVIKLTRAGHYLWFRLRNAKLALPVSERVAILEALEIIWEAKRQVKAQIKARNAERFKSWQQRPAA
jgi:hypothetical protein